MPVLRGFTPARCTPCNVPACLSTLPTPAFTAARRPNLAAPCPVATTDFCTRGSPTSSRSGAGVRICGAALPAAAWLARVAVPAAAAARGAGVRSCCCRCGWPCCVWLARTAGVGTLSDLVNTGRGGVSLRDLSVVLLRLNSTGPCRAPPVGTATVFTACSDNVC